MNPDPAAGSDFGPAVLGWPERVVNAGGHAIGAVSRHPIPSLQPQDLISEAMHHTGLTDLGHDWPDQSFHALTHALSWEAHLTQLGRMFAHRQVSRDVSMRLRIVDVLTRRPEVLDRPVVRPILMVNMPRAGSTLLQFLLARAPETRSLWPWEIADPVTAAEGSPEAVRAVQRRTRRHYRLVDRLVPAYRDIHPMTVDEPEECNGLLARSFVSLDLASIYRVPSYVDHVLSTDLRPAYRNLKAQVQLIQRTEPPRRWVLRSPAHLFGVDAALEVFPDAVVVQLHRDPLASLASFCSLAATLRQANSRPVDLHSLGPRWMDLWAQGLERSLAARITAPPGATFVDVDYRDLVARPLEVVERIRHEVSEDPIPLNSGVIQTRVDAGHRNPHRYEPEWFGLDPVAVAERYADYSERFGLTMSS